MRDQPGFKPLVSYFQISDKDSCAQAIRTGGYAAAISAGLTALVGVLGLFVKMPDSPLGIFLDPWVIIDAVFAAILAYFVFRKSRFAATILFIYFIASKILILIELSEISSSPRSSPTNPLLLIFLGIAYFNAMRATYIWHRLYREGASTNTPSSFG
jgi:Na+/H+ antiporter NhaA